MKRRAAKETRALDSERRGRATSPERLPWIDKDGMGCWVNERRRGAEPRRAAEDGVGKRAG
jgi:hypothetical protein